MKELSIEEKAKRYDEAIKRVVNIRTGKCKTTFMFTEGLFDYIFSELAESEDERIRKEIISAIKEDWPGHTDWIAWLEKQGENNMGISEATKKKLEDSLNEALGKETPESWNKFLDEQGEQKLANKVKPKFKVGDIISNGISEVKIVSIDKNNYNVTNGEIENDAHAGNWVIYFKDQDNWELVEQKPAWSEEDEKILNLIIARLHSHPNVEVEEYGKDYHWLNFLKERAQPKREWSEEDENTVASIISSLSNPQLYPPTIHDIEWLKSLKDRYTWKPTDEQMDELENEYLKSIPKY